MIDIDAFRPLVQRDHPSQLVVAVAQVGKQLYWGWNSWTRGSKHLTARLPGGVILHTRHAEDHVLSKIPRSTPGHRITIYVSRFMNSGGLGMALPCHRCQRRLFERGVYVRNVYYTGVDGEWERLRAWDFVNRKNKGKE